MRPPQDWRAARATLWIAGVTAFAWLLVSTLGWDRAAAVYGGFIPGRVGGLANDPAPLFALLTPLTATLVHAGFLHLAFNLLMLVVCGRSIEPIIGARGVLILYLVGAYAAAAAQWAADPGVFIPMVGASGAISAVVGAYALLFGRNRVKVANARLAAWLHALWLGAAWIGLQVLVGLTFMTSGMSIAVAAHIGGFLAGLLLAKPLLWLRWRGA
ncbi:MAG TPA: rhomboid family intramembrane serine protease [Allosphingosinicella sp.]|nr:rhomboid family intramembrane serine protease [Allosphingosinicella sp.]